MSKGSINPYMVVVKEGGETKTLGSHRTREDAAQAYAQHIWLTQSRRADDEGQAAAAASAAPERPTKSKQMRPTSKPTPPEQSVPRPKPTLLPLWRSENATGYKGVTVASGKGVKNSARPYMVVVKERGATRSLGTHKTAIDAAKAYAEYMWSRRNQLADD